jgi:hypothetical protein
LPGFDGGTDSFDDLVEGLVLCVPLGYRLPAAGQRLQLAERSAFPVAWLEDDGDDLGVPIIMPLDSVSDLDVVAIVGLDKVSADEQQNEAGSAQLFVDLVPPFRTGSYLPIGPVRDEALTSHSAEMGFKFLAVLVVFVRI